MSSKNWLLCYEGSVKGFFPHINKSIYIDNDQFFAALKSNNVTFYDNKKQVQDLVKYIIEPFDFDNEDNDDTNNSSWMLY